jgi:raffinose/stachyose/melibiose transport system substrate-binding protein
MSILIACLAFTPLVAQGSQEQKQEGPVGIEFFSMKNEAQGVMGTLVDNFEKQNPDIKITQTFVPDNETVFKTRLASKDVPDVTNIFPATPFYKKVFTEGFLADLTGQKFLDQVPEFVRKIAEADGKDFALPVTLSIFGLYVRTDILEKYNLPKPTTYDLLISDCKALKQHGIIPISFADKDTWTIGQILERLIGVINNDNDSEFKKIADGSLAVADSSTLRTFAKMMVELHEYSYDDSMAVSYDDSLADVASGKCAMFIMGSWSLGTIETSDPNIDTKLEMIPFPNPTGGETRVPINIDTAYSISATTPHKDACLKFLTFLSETNNAQLYADEEKTPNIIKGVNYNVVPFKSIVDNYLNKGKIFLTPVNIWPNGLRDQLKVPAQQLYIDKNVDAFLASCGKIIKDYYNK